MKVLITDNTHPILQEKLENAGIVVTVDYNTNYNQLLSIIDNYDGLVVRSKIVIDSDFIAQCHRLKCIGRVGAGMDTIDVESAERKGIRCLNSPEGNCDAVGEHTLGLLLALFNKIASANMDVRKGLWQREANRGIEIKGKTIGIIGFGNMGGAFAKRLAGFDCHVLAYDILGSQASGFSLHLPYVENVSLNTLQANADVVSLHVPLTPSTQYLVDSQFLNTFAKPIFLLNTSRGAVVNTCDLVTALQSQQVLGAALDVIEYENMANDGLSIDHLPNDFRYLLQCANTIVTPHVAGWTIESKYKLAAVLADKIINCLKTDPQ